MPPPEPAASDALLAAVVRSASDAIITVDLKGIVTSWNAGAERLLGHAAAAMIGQSIDRIIPPDRMHEEQDILDRFHRGERVEHFSTVRVTRNGTEVPVSISASALTDRDGHLTGTSQVARDMTVMTDASVTLAAHARGLERKIRERTRGLEDSVAELEGVTYSLSHDMRGPIRAIHSFTEIVLEEHGAEIGAEGSDYLRRVIAAAARLDRLIKDVLAFTRLARGSEELSQVDVESLVRGLMRELPELSEPRATVRVDSLPMVVGHETLLGQCLANLLDNAVKFVPPDGKPEVRVFAEDRGNRARICVQDNGIGMDEDGQRRVFTMFERLPTEEAYAGTGLGLAIVRKAAERMRGSVGVRSAPGAGSTFWIELPRAGA